MPIVTRIAANMSELSDAAMVSSESTTSTPARSIASVGGRPMPQRRFDMIEIETGVCESASQRISSALAWMQCTSSRSAPSTPCSW